MSEALSFECLSWLEDECGFPSGFLIPGVTQMAYGIEEGYVLSRGGACYVIEHFSVDVNWTVGSETQCVVWWDGRLTASSQSLVLAVTELARLIWTEPRSQEQLRDKQRN